MLKGVNSLADTLPMGRIDIMIDRSYLPFQSARDYQDVGMQKWMGFFLSEHTTALSAEENAISYFPSLPQEQRLLLLSQLYANQLTARFTIKERNGLRVYSGSISTLTSQYALIKTPEGYINAPLEYITAMELIEEILHESA